MGKTNCEKVQISLASDQRYYCGLLVTAASIAKNASSDATLVFNILDSGIDDASFDSLKKKVLACHAKSEFVRLKVSQKSFENYPIYHGSWMTYARLLLADLLPDVDHVIYCDVDFLWLADIAELWRKRDDDVIMMSTVEPFLSKDAKEKECAWFTRNGFKFDASRYFCAGLSFYNLKKFREEDMVRKIVDFLNAHPDVNIVDQTAMNVLMAGRVKMLPREWAAFSRDIREDDLMSDIVIHYSGDCPWTSRLFSDIHMLWFRYDAMLNGRSVFASLRAYYPLMQIIVRRLLNPCMRNRIFRSLVVAVLRHTGGGAANAQAVNDYHSTCNRHLPIVWKMKI